MKHFKIGVRLESMGLSLRRALHEAQRLGVEGVQADAIGELSPHTLSDTGRRAVRQLLQSQGLALTALGCPLRQELDSPHDQQQRIDHIKAALDLSVELEARLTIVHAGRVPARVDAPGARLMTEALQVLGSHGDRIGAVLALETGLDSGQVTAAFLKRFDTGSLGVNLDPANLLLHDFDPCAAARELGDKVVHVRATDARRAGGAGPTRQIPLGQGDVAWAHYLDVLQEIDYRGWLIVERWGGGNRIAEVATDVGFLARCLGLQNN